MIIAGIFLSVLVWFLIIQGAIATTLPKHIYFLGAIPIGLIIFLVIYIGFFASHEAIEEKETTPE